MKAQLKRAARKVLKTAAVAIDPVLGSLPGPRILIYHQVGVDYGREMEVSTASFMQQLDWIDRNGEVVDLATAIDRRGESNADKLFVLTFDDGFVDLHRNAYPLLKERGLPFTLYLTTNPIEAGEPLDARYGAALPLTWDQVNEMAGTGLMTVGAHTHTHPDLRSLSPAEIETELETSNRLIEDRTGIRPRHFTYPWGWWSGEADRLVRDRYTTATLGAGPGIVAETDTFLINRIPVQRSDSSFTIGSKLAHGAPLENRIRRRVVGYDGP